MSIKGKCICCGHNRIAATIHDFKFDENRTPIDYDVCANHLIALATRCLEPKDVKTIREFAGCEVFHTHEDFYDENGNTLQPMH